MASLIPNSKMLYLKHQSGAGSDLKTSAAAKFMRFLGIIFRFFRLEVSTSTLGFGFLQNAIHEQT
jgi:hypothetical protein